MKAFTIENDLFLFGIQAWAVPRLCVDVGNAEVKVDRAAVGEWIPGRGEAYAAIIYDAGVRYEDGQPVLCAPETDEEGCLVHWIVGNQDSARLDIPDALAYSHGVLIGGGETASALFVLRPGQEAWAERGDEILVLRLVNGLPEVSMRRRL